MNKNLEAALQSRFAIIPSLASMARFRQLLNYYQAHPATARNVRKNLWASQQSYEQIFSSLLVNNYPNVEQLPIAEFIKLCRLHSNLQIWYFTQLTNPRTTQAIWSQSCQQLYQAGYHAVFGRKQALSNNERLIEFYIALMVFDQLFFSIHYQNVHKHNTSKTLAEELLKRKIVHRVDLQPYASTLVMRLHPQDYLRHPTSSAHANAFNTVLDNLPTIILPRGRHVRTILHEKMHGLYSYYYHLLPKRNNIFSFLAKSAHKEIIPHFYARGLVSFSLGNLNIEQDIQEIRKYLPIAEWQQDCEHFFQKLGEYLFIIEQWKKISKQHELPYHAVTPLLLTPLQHAAQLRRLIEYYTKKSFHVPFAQYYYCPGFYYFTYWCNQLVTAKTVRQRQRAYRVICDTVYMVGSHLTSEQLRLLYHSLNRINQHTKQATTVYDGLEELQHYVRFLSKYSRQHR